MLLYYFLASLGLCFILKYATILNLSRNYLKDKSDFLKELFDCSMCLGFWCGAAIVPFLWNYENIKYVSLLYPFASSAFCWIVDILLEAVISFTNLVKEEHKEVLRKPL